MRVLLVSHLALPHVGGVEFLVHREIMTLVGRGHRVVLVTSDGGGVAEDPSYPEGVRVVRVRAWHGLERRWGLPYPIFSPRVIPVLWRETRACDVVHAHGCLFLNSVVALLIGRGRGRPCILTDHGGAQRFDSRVKTLLARAGIETVGRLTVRLAMRLTSYNARVIGTLDRLAGRAGAALFVANPVDRDLFRPPSETERQGARARLGWGPGRAKVLFVGRLTEDKGVHVLLEARDEASYDLAFCGPGDPSILGPPTGGVEYLPPRPQRQLVSLYHAADALAVPSSAREAFPVVVQEALACGLPVVMSYEAGYAPYRALPGLIFCDREPVAMKRALRQALRRPRSAATDDLDAFCPDPATWLRAVYGAEIAEVDGRSTQRCQ